MLKHRATSAVIWSAGEQFVKSGLGFVTSVIMARLVSPDEFGTIALLYLFIGVAGVFVDGGFSAALIQRNNASHTEETAVFWFNIAIGSVAAVALFSSAPAIAAFYEKPVVAPLTQLVSVQIFLSAFNSVQNALFMRRLDFKTPLKIGLASIVFSGSVGILMASRGLGVWALVGQSLAGILIQTVLIWFLSPWRPALSFSYTALSSLFRFGGYLFLSQLLNVGYERLYTLIIGKLFGTHDLGIYSRADGIKQLPAGVLSGILSRVAFPIYSQARGDVSLLVNGFRFSIRGAMLINVPVMLGLCLVAEPLVLTIFGPSWQESAHLLRILAIAGILWPLHSLNLSLLMALGYSKKFLRVEIAKKIVGLVLLVIGAFYGIEGIAYSTVASSLFAFLLNAYYSGKIVQHGAWRQMVDIAPALLCGVIMSLMVAFGATTLSFDPAMQLGILTISGAFAYFVLINILCASDCRKIYSLLKFPRKTIN